MEHRCRPRVGGCGSLGLLYKLQKEPSFPHLLPSSPSLSFVTLPPCGMSLPCLFPKR